VESGDIDNRSAARIIYLFEGTIGHLSATGIKKRAFHLRLRQWKRAAACWELDAHVLKVLIDLQYRSPYNVDLATYLDYDEAEAVEERLDRQGVLYGNFIITTPVEMTRVIVNQPNIAAVFDFDPARRFMYGGKGRTGVAL
jgi:hypothetical protein